MFRPDLSQWHRRATVRALYPEVLIPLVTTQETFAECTLLGCLCTKARLIRTETLPAANRAHVRAQVGLAKQQLPSSVAG